jgi:hypothetical protein
MPIRRGHERHLVLVPEQARRIENCRTAALAERIRDDAAKVARGNINVEDFDQCRFGHCGVPFRPNSNSARVEGSESMHSGLRQTMTYFLRRSCRLGHLGIAPLIIADR